MFTFNLIFFCYPILQNRYAKAKALINVLKKLSDIKKYFLLQENKCRALE